MSCRQINTKYMKLFNIESVNYDCIVSLILTSAELKQHATIIKQMINLKSICLYNYSSNITKECDYIANFSILSNFSYIDNNNIIHNITDISHVITDKWLLIIYLDAVSNIILCNSKHINLLFIYNNEYYRLNKLRHTYILKVAYYYLRPPNVMVNLPYTLKHLHLNYYKNKIAPLKTPYKCKIT